MPTSNTYISSRMRLHYVDWGNHDAPMLLLIHGGLDHCRSWDWTAKRLRSDWHIVAIDLAGHGDSAWSPDGRYSVDGFVGDLAQFLHQKGDSPVAIIAHSLGGAVASRYAGIYPERVRKLALIEGLGWSPKIQAERDLVSIDQLLRTSHEDRRTMSGRHIRRYETIGDAIERMQQENPNLSATQATHLTEHGVSQNEDGTYSWKFDNYARLMAPLDVSAQQIQTLWARIACPILLFHGNDSWASNPREDGRLLQFNDAKLIEYADAGHWLHHDQFEHFIADVAAYLHAD